jgi:hypothetical protein
MKTLLDCFGCAVRLTDERLAHILQHPEMMGFRWFPSSALIVIHKSSQARKAVLGMDAEIQAMDGSQTTVQVLDS